MACVIHNDRGFANPAAVSVNGVVIPRDAIARETQNHRAGKPIAAWQAAARALVIRELLLQEARRLAVEPEPRVDSLGRRETDDEASIRRLVEGEVTTPEPDAASCRRYYDQNRARFCSPVLYEAAHILFAARRDDAEAFARAAQKARSVLEALQREPARFAELAQAHSDCPSAAQGGNLGQLVASQTTPEFAAALASLRVGAITRDPVATRYGLHIVRLDRKIAERQLPFELVAERIAAYLREAVTRRAVAQYIARLVSRSAITGVAVDGALAHRVN